ncbi:DUF4250 domain-containing protein [Vibrio ostreicida]|uniref:DUF4250 domain-containing protein n=1 Tax=Vibrio ostreicida TaxID=526588 RepID=A0ABT8BTJ8_9VIBR|nr:DUF4250 domain-containing protein [Vibrio ostreicida]MDN3610308.1 DUF4250 domain-containing protein [Vibrio ostreicida]NPD07678.1 DUF4250 domain-containing protein [Vibrio ostreicida]
MDLSNIGSLDSVILLGIVNEKLRIECHSLQDLVTMYEMDADTLVVKLDVVGYCYDPLTNQFKANAG